MPVVYFRCFLIIIVWVTGRAPARAAAIFDPVNVGYQELVGSASAVDGPAQAQVTDDRAGVQVEAFIVNTPECPASN